MLTYPTLNNRNFLSSGWFLTKKTSTFTLKKDISIDSNFFLQARQKINVLTGSCSVAEDRFQRPQETKITTMQSCILRRSKVSVVTAYMDVTVYRAWLSYRDLHIFRRKEWFIGRVCMKGFCAVTRTESGVVQRRGEVFTITNLGHPGACPCPKFLDALECNFRPH